MRVHGYRCPGPFGAGISYAVETGGSILQLCLDTTLCDVQTTCGRDAVMIIAGWVETRLRASGEMRQNPPSNVTDRGQVLYG